MTTTKRVGAILVLASLAFVLSSRPATEGSTVAGREVRASGNVCGGSGRDECVTSTSAVPVGENRTSLKTQTDVTLARTTPRALLIPRGQPLTVVRDENDPELAVIEAAREWNIAAVPSVLGPPKAEPPYLS